MAQSIFDYLSGPTKANFIFSFIMMILFSILTIPPFFTFKHLMGRERVAMLILLFSIIFAAGSYASQFASWVEVNPPVDLFKLIVLESLKNEFLYISAAAMFSSLLLFNSCTFNRETSGSKQVPLASLLSFIMCGFWLGLATLYTILYATYSSAFYKTTTRSEINALGPHKRASEVFYIIHHLVLLGLSVCLLICTFIIRLKSSEYQIHKLFRFIISPLLIVLSLGTLCTSVAYIVTNQNARATCNNPSETVNLVIIQHQVDLADTLFWGIILFLVNLLTVGAVALIVRDRSRKVNQEGPFRRLDSISAAPAA